LNKSKSLKLRNPTNMTDKPIRSRSQKIVRVPTVLEIALGAAPKQLEIIPGNTYALAPHADLWMRGAKTARVKYVVLDRAGNPTGVGVAPIVGVTEIKGSYVIPVEHFA
jgi:hypothetical protein